MTHDSMGVSEEQRGNAFTLETVYDFWDSIRYVFGPLVVVFCCFFPLTKSHSGLTGTCRVCLLHLRASISAAPAIPTITLRPQVGSQKDQKGL